MFWEVEAYTSPVDSGHYRRLALIPVCYRYQADRLDKKNENREVTLEAVIPAYYRRYVIMYGKAISIVKAFCLILILVLSGCDKGETPTGPEFNSLEEEIDNIARQYVKVGAMIGVINKEQEKLIFSYGTKSFNTDDPPDANSVFEIGSITKTFTATLLADMSLRGVFTDDIVSHYLPADQVTLPSRDGVEITFGHLATHTSGIPEAPHEDDSNFPLPPDFNFFSPYASYTTEHVYDYLTNYCTLSFVPETYWEYSNTGMGLLGHTLGLIDGTSYDSILTRYLFDVLEMDNSSIYLNEQQDNNLAQSHNSNYEPGLYFIANDIFQGAGSIKSSLNDMFKYLEAQMGLVETPLRNAINLTHQPQLRQGSLGDQGLAWFTLELDDGQVITYHGGDTYGYSAYIGFNKSASTGVIALFNYGLSGTQIGMGQDILKAINKY